MRRDPVTVVIALVALGALVLTGDRVIGWLEQGLRR